MQTIKLALIALAATLTLGAANADEAGKMEVIIVTAARPEAIESPQLSTPEPALPAIDFAELKIVRPTLDPSAVEPKRERMELAVRDEPGLQSAAQR